MTAALCTTQESAVFDNEIFGTQDEHELAHGLCWFDTRQKAEQAIGRFEIATGTKFIKLSHDTYDRAKSRIWWKIGVKNGYEAEGIFLGVPYIILSTAKLECQFGKDRDHNRKEKRKRMSTEHGVLTGASKRKYNQVKGSKKKNCEASITVREVVRFPQFEITSDTKSKREHASKRLRTALQSIGAELQEEFRCYVQFPTMSAHSGHETCQVEGFLLTDDNIPGNETLMILEDEQEVKPQVIQIITDVSDQNNDPGFSVDQLSAPCEESSSHINTVEVTTTSPMVFKFTHPDPGALMRVDQLLDDIRVAVMSVTSQEAMTRVERGLQKVLGDLNTW